MTNPIHDELDTSKTNTWALNALTEALGDLTVTVSESLSVGRGSDNDVVLGSKQVSRNHAVLSVLDGQLYVKDLDSSNGTFINNERIEGNMSSLLQANDTIGFASFNFKVNTSVADAEMNSQTESLTPVMADDAATITDTKEPVVAAEPIVEEPIVQEPVVEEPVVEEPVVEAPIIDEPITENPVVQESIAEEPVVKEPVIEAPVAQEPVVKKTHIEEMSPVKDEVVPTLSNSDATISDASSTAATHESANTLETSPTPTTEHEPLVEAEQPAVHKEQAIHEEPIVQPEHDKTTKTELQEEADPEVLRAKQAATAQFSGTANLGQGHDLGTTGNNAMDQAVDNPATTEQVEKKPSGGWFIWVFIALIIIGVALWLFNMGGAGA